MPGSYSYLSPTCSFPDSPPPPGSQTARNNGGAFSYVFLKTWEVLILALVMCALVALLIVQFLIKCDPRLILGLNLGSPLTLEPHNT